jgi:chaperonin GroES
LGDQLLVRMEPEEPTSELVFLPQARRADRQPRRGLVVATGAGQTTATGGRMPMAVAAGDIVLVPPNAGQGLRLRLNGQEHLLVRERDVLAIIEN